MIARRLAERGVKYQTLFHLGWDLHLAIKQNFPLRCGEIDQPAAALVMDLKQRGLLDDTLVMFGSEFGRTPFAQGQIDNPLVGRDHHGGCSLGGLPAAALKQATLMARPTSSATTR